MNGLIKIRRFIIIINIERKKSGEKMAYKNFVLLIYYLLIPTKELFTKYQTERESTLSIQTETEFVMMTI